MKRKKIKRQTVTVTRGKQMVILREPGVLPAGWHKGLVPDNDPAGDETKSAVFQHFADPLLDENETLSSLNTKYDLAMMGWNLGMLPAQDRLKSLASLLEDMPADLRGQVEVTLQYLIERKDARFADYPWFIHAFHLEPKGTGAVLSVAAILPPPAVDTVK